MSVDRSRRACVHEADKESRDEQEGRKWTGGLYSVGKEWLARIKSNRPDIASPTAVASRFSKNPSHTTH